MYTLPCKATISNCDRDGRLKFHSALQMMQDCSELWIDSEPAVQRCFEEESMAQLLVSRQVEVVRVPVCKEDLTVSTSVYDVKPMFGFRNTFIRDAAGKPCYRTWSMGAFVDRATGKLKRATPAMVETIHLEPRLEMEYGDRRIRVPDGGGEKAAPIPVARADIDYNRHVNNACYVRMAMELLPDGFEVRGFRVEYRAPARLGDVLEPTVFASADGAVRTVVLSRRGETSVLVEFTGGPGAVPPEDAP